MCRPVIRHPIATTVLLRIAARTGRAEVFKLVRGERRAWRNQFPVSINLFVDVLRSRRDVALLVPVVPALVRDRIPEAVSVVVRALAVQHGGVLRDRIFSFRISKRRGQDLHVMRDTRRLVKVDQVFVAIADDNARDVGVGAQLSGSSVALTVAGGTVLGTVLSFLVRISPKQSTRDGCLHRF